MAEVYMYIYNWQEKKEENQALEDFCHAPTKGVLISRLAFFGGSAYISTVNATQVIEEIQRLPDEQVERVYQYLFSAENEMDRALAAFDRLPRKSVLTEEEILALPRARSSRQ
jgi:hypothetical protein